MTKQIIIVVRHGHTVVCKAVYVLHDHGQVTGKIKGHGQVMTTVRQESESDDTMAT